MLRTRRNLTKAFALSGACGASYAYGKWGLTPLDYPEMAIRSGRLGVTVLKIVKNFGDMKKLSPEAYKEQMPEFHVRTAQMLYDMCCANRGTYIKVGQHIGAMEYLLPIQYIDRFKTLHADAPKSTEAEIRSVVRAELGTDLEEVFDDWDWSPLGAASLAQCHKARLKETGEVVAVKVQHAAVQHSAHLDLMLMELGVMQCARLFPEFKLGWLARTTRQNLPRELDFLNEASNADRCRQLMKDIPWLKIPKNLHKYCTSRLLVMEYLPGTMVSNKQELNQRKIDVDKTVERVTEMYSEMIFNHGFIHCDPHPGNVLINKGKDGHPEIVLLDHGLYETISQDFQYNYSMLWRSMIRGDEKSLRKSSAALNVESMFPLLAAMVSGRSWQSVKQGLKNTESITKKEDELIQAEISMWIPEMSEILEHIPKQMILVLKTNDLLRGLETTLGCRPGVASFVHMSEYCLRMMYAVEKLDRPSWKLYFDFQKEMWAIFFYKMYLRTTKWGGEKVTDLLHGTKDERMVEWNKAFERTSS